MSVFTLRNKSHFCVVFLTFLFSAESSAGPDSLPYTARLDRKVFSAEAGPAWARTELSFAGTFMRDDADQLTTLNFRRDFVEYPERRTLPTRLHWATDFSLRSSWVSTASQKLEMGYGIAPALYWQMLDSFGAGCRALWDYGELEDLQIGGGEFDFVWSINSHWRVNFRAGYLGYLARAMSETELRVYSQRDEKSLGLTYRSPRNWDWSLRGAWMKYSEEDLDLLLSQLSTQSSGDLVESLNQNSLTSFRLLTQNFFKYRGELEVGLGASENWTHRFWIRAAKSAFSGPSGWASVRWESTQKGDSNAWQPTYGFEFEASDLNWGVLGIFRLSR